MIGYVIRVYILSVATQPGCCIFSIVVSVRTLYTLWSGMAHDSIVRPEVLLKTLEKVSTRCYGQTMARRKAVANLPNCVAGSCGLLHGP